MQEPQPEEGVDLLGNGLIRMATLQHGDASRPCPVKGDVADVEVVKVLLEDQDHAVPPNRTFRLGDGDECDALELVVPRMRPGEVAAIRSVPAAFRLDSSLCKARPAAEVKAVVRLLRARRLPPVSGLPLAERASEARRKRETGDLLFSREEFAAAGYSLALGVEYIAEACHRHAAEDEHAQKAEAEGREEVSDEVLGLCCNLYTSLALSQLKAGAVAPGSAVDTCKAALSLQPKNSTAWYLKARAHLRDLAEEPLPERDRQDAISALEHLLVLDPDHEQAAELLETARGMKGVDLGEDSFMNSRWYSWLVTGLLLAVLPSLFKMVRSDIKLLMGWMNDTAPEGMLADDVSF